MGKTIFLEGRASFARPSRPRQKKIYRELVLDIDTGLVVFEDSFRHEGALALLGTFSDYWENKILDHIFNKAAYTAPTIYAGLSTADPLDDASGLAEPAGNGYARKSTLAADWNAAVAGLIDNANPITFAQATGSWGTITHFALFDAATLGNMLAHGALTVSKAVGNGDTVEFAAGDLDVSLD